MKGKEMKQDFMIQMQEQIEIQTKLNLKEITNLKKIAKKVKNKILKNGIKK